MSEENPILNPEWIKSRYGKGIREVSQEIVEWLEKEPVKRKTEKIEGVDSGSAAETGGLLVGDIIKKIDGKSVNIFSFSEAVDSANGRDVVFEVERNGELLKLSVQPAWNENYKSWKIGINIAEDTKDFEMFGNEKRVSFALDTSSTEFVKGYTDLVREKGSILIKRYVLLFKKDGRQMEIDLIERFVPAGSVCILDPDLSSAGRCMGKDIRIKELLNSLTPHAIVHELRHVEQNRTGNNFEEYIGTQYDDLALMKLVVFGGGRKKIMSNLLKTGLVSGTEEVESLTKHLPEEFSPDDETRFNEMSQRAASLKEEVEKETQQLLKEWILSSADEGFEQLLQEDLNNLSPEKEKEILGFLKLKMNEVVCSEEIGEDWFFVLDLLSLSLQDEAVWKEIKLREGAFVFEVKGLSFTIPLKKDNQKSTFKVAALERARIEKNEQDKLKEIDAQIREELKTFPLNLETLVYKGLSVRDVLRLPTLITERDAEYGALVALRALKKETGLNLLMIIRENRELDLDSPDLFKSITASGHILSLDSIQKYMKDIGVDIPCVRKARSDLRKKVTIPSQNIQPTEVS